MTISRQLPRGSAGKPEIRFPSAPLTGRFSTETFGSDSVSRSRSTPLDARKVKGGAAMAHELLDGLCAATTVRGARGEARDRKQLQALMVRDPSGPETGAGKRRTSFQKSPTEHVSFLMMLRGRIEKAPGRTALFRATEMRMARAMEWA
ncbi:TPA: hypothetical protein QDC22_005371 [Burkholderia stabilis]|nr:hypothetical protein [Burkholderia stabilis]HDR9651482.1 hypothetical protein [Burkholderia stabilis]HDR9657134.1 hypothetical protein [Burkholderia stabilis]HDR9681678.1 hypothetical protein [Burkholderia stabilis]